MAVLWITQFMIVTLNIFLGILFVLANKDFCGSVFETQVDHALVDHVIQTNVVVDEFECQLKCMGNNSCKSINVHRGDSNGKRSCELNNKTRQMKPGHFKKKKGSTYYSSVQVGSSFVYSEQRSKAEREEKSSPFCFTNQASCLDISRGRKQTTKSGQCHPEYKGKHCETPVPGWSSRHPALSCKQILEAGNSKGDGEYWIDPEKNGSSLKVFCDMTTDGGKHCK
ncbi:unnamed protein product [Pocillopora meandrina]|uniref:Apple domain-containing protein n=1 Tax=Pocillopora meandrina TaxID=46732 RepID=A0AAU9X5U6_9CNID|nr:unnamed protein product [Pocillopora meandrina]